jgi:ATP-binding cassette subfamily F protein 3
MDLDERDDVTKVLANNPNLLILDEPTNHLDIASREALESALREYKGTVLVASHDRYLLDAIADEIIEIKDGTFTHFLGNYSRYREKTQPAPEPSAPVNRSKQPEPVKARPMSTLRQLEKQLRDLNKRQKELEGEIERTEARMHELTEALGNEENYRNGSAKDLSAEYEGLNTRLHSDYAEWEKVSEEIMVVEGELGEVGRS